MKQLITIITTLLLFGCLHAQVTDFDEWKKAQQDKYNKYNNFVNQQQFVAFCGSINAAYAESFFLGISAEGVFDVWSYTLNLP
ncbi:MAG: hypothetical protein IKO89_04005 [Bacteroidales bacterium]|nr:hypothetical protein [Bacteroidales bacterium]MBR4487709.1 hypothetical protein [Bacteroidales bacterium]